MKTPEVIVFDLGKVLVDFDYSIASRKIAAHGKVPAAAVQQFIDHSALLFRFETGSIDRRQFYEAICQITGYTGSLEEFSCFFADIFTPIAEMVALHARLREQRVPTAIFSNTNDLAIGHIRRNFTFFAHFDAYVLSYEHGAMKPDARLYQEVERVTRRQGEQIGYLDDRLENAQAGAARGWQVIHHQTPAQSIAALRRLGLPV